jgi:serine/threonine protein kinase
MMPTELDLVLRVAAVNILITRDYELKIADWGLARTVNDPEGGYMTNPVVTLYYRAPEVLMGSQNYDRPIDIFSVGCVKLVAATEARLLYVAPSHSVRTGRGNEEPCLMRLMITMYGRYIMKRKAPA